MARYLALKNSYVINSFLWDGVTSFTYPCEDCDYIVDDDNLGNIGDLYDGFNEEFVKFTEKPTDPNYPESLDYLWIPLIIDPITVIYNWGAYWTAIGDGTGSAAESEIFYIPKDCSLLLVYDVIEGDINILSNISGFEGMPIVYREDIDMYVQGAEEFLENDEVQLYFEIDSSETGPTGVKATVYLYETYGTSSPLSLDHLITSAELYLYKA